jgi:hypothetical protein
MAFDTLHTSVGASDDGARTRSFRDRRTPIVSGSYLVRCTLLSPVLALISRSGPCHRLHHSSVSARWGWGDCSGRSGFENRRSGVRGFGGSRVRGFAGSGVRGSGASPAVAIALVATGLAPPAGLDANQAHAAAAVAALVSDARRARVRRDVRGRVGRGSRRGGHLRRPASGRRRWLIRFVHRLTIDIDRRSSRGRSRPGSGRFRDHTRCCASSPCSRPDADRLGSYHRISGARSALVAQCCAIQRLMIRRFSRSREGRTRFRVRGPRSDKTFTTCGSPA